jgi:hypothetical protein
MYKYNELQMSDVTQKLNYKASCKTFFFCHSDILLKYPTYTQQSCQCLHFKHFVTEQLLNIGKIHNWANEILIFVKLGQINGGFNIWALNKT